MSVLRSGDSATSIRQRGADEIGVDELMEIGTLLTNASESRRDELYAFLRSVFDSNEYQDWLSNESQSGSRPRLPAELARRSLHLVHRMAEYGLTENGFLRVKIDELNGRIHLTDGFFVEPSDRVFPTTDESELVCDWIRERFLGTGGWPEHATFLIDPACGSGHHGLNLADEFMKQVSLDLSPRAVAFARLNTLLAVKRNHLVAINDVRAGLPKEIVPAAGHHVVFAVNMPFAIDPPIESDQLPRALAQDGGRHGLELTCAAISAIAMFMAENALLAEPNPVDAAILCYSLGQGDDPATYEVTEILQSELGHVGQVGFELLREQPLWRVNGVKEQPNPMPVESLGLKADCDFTFPGEIRDLKRKAYDQLAARFRATGFTHFGYGIAHFRFSPRAAD